MHLTHFRLDTILCIGLNTKRHPTFVSPVLPRKLDAIRRIPAIASFSKRIGLSLVADQAVLRIGMKQQ